MRFFQWSSVVQMLAGWFLVTEQNAIYVRSLELILGVAVGGALFLGLTVLGGFGLMKMAKKQGKKYHALAFIPIVNTWYAGYVAGETTVFGKKMKRAGLYAALLEAAAVAASVLSVVLEFYLASYAVSVPYEEVGTVTYYEILISPDVASAHMWMLEALYGLGEVGWLDIVTGILSLAFIVFEVIVLIALFKKYSPRNYTVLTVVCVLFPVREIVFFALRNRTPIDYREYLRRCAEAYARRNYPYGNPYGGQNPYGNDPYGPNGQSGQNGQGGQGDPSPFRDFDPPQGGNSDDPFDEFK